MGAPAGTNVSSSNTADREIVATRVFDAPRPLVWKMWTDPHHVAQWWGPTGFTNTIQEMDVRPGGVWRFIMHGPDGTDYPNKNVYVEVVKHERLVFDHAAPNFRATATFADDGADKTTVTMRMVFETAELREKIAKQFNAVEGLHQTLGRLGEKLAAHAGPSKPFIISRVFDAPRELVWKAWTERDRLMQWFGPKGFTMEAATLDLRPGGIFHYCLRSPEGQKMWGKFTYREIVPPERIVLVNSFSDENGNITRHPMSPTWPREMLSTTTLIERDGKTLLTIQWEPLNPTPEERQTFDVARPGMDGGWTGTFEQLAEYLSSAQA